MCVFLYAKRLSGVLRQHILAIFICFILNAKRISGVLSERILMTYSPLIFAYANYAGQSMFFNSARITYFCMRMTPTFLSKKFTAYLCMIFVWVKLSQNLPLYISQYNKVTITVKKVVWISKVQLVFKSVPIIYYKCFTVSTRFFFFFMWIVDDL